ncbi:MAG: 50S ribosomal protein L4 [Candidatus Wildermuthbacteria bacterium]|nr:50S ribosomal protein L4 [Candidatus Wildermuthbacteria bacterium]
MARVMTYNIEGKETGSVELPARVFEAPFRADLVHQVLVIQQGNRRQVSAHARGRGEVSGGGKKPWRQKGTGRARHGSIRSPLWKGGGVSHGPVKERNYRGDINEKMRKAALFCVLSEKARNQECVVVDGLNMEKPGTKQLAGIFEKLPLSGKTVLLALPVLSREILLSARNLPGVRVMQARELTALDALNAGVVLLPAESVKILAEIHGA